MVEKVNINNNNYKSKFGAQRTRNLGDTTLNNAAIELSFVRHKLEQFQTTMISEVQHRMSGMIEEMVQELQRHELQAHEFKDTWCNRMTVNRPKVDATECEIDGNAEVNTKARRVGRQRTLPDKVFVQRESYLTALMEVDHIKGIYHIFVTILLVLFLNTMCYDYFVEGSVNFGLSTFKTGFRGIHIVGGIWLLQHVFVFTLYYAFKMWAVVRGQLLAHKPLQRFWTYSCLIAFTGSQLSFGYIPSRLCLKLDLPFISSSVLLLESIRLIMKMYAFVRTNAGQVVNGRPLKLKTDHDDVQQLNPTAFVMPPFTCYLYFLFAPSLLYRDSYPRTAQIRWKFASCRLLEVVSIAFLYSYIYERHIKVHFDNYGLEPFSANLLIAKFFGMLMPATIIFICGFYLILHSWLNFASELMRFGDRMFYKDWWTASSYEEYFRDWNVVVHDFLYEYIYKDCYTHIFKGSKLAASMMVFMVSALVHDYLLSIALQLFFPVIFVLFGILGVTFVFCMPRNAPKSLGNIFLWFTLVTGNGLMISLYCMEYHARFNCPKSNVTWIDHIVPTTWSCYNS